MPVYGNAKQRVIYIIFIVARLNGYTRLFFKSCPTL